jgi:hypothetical protein
MDIELIVRALKVHRDRINAAMVALSGSDLRNGRRGRLLRAAAAPTYVQRKPRRRLSAAARRRISEAAKARWAKAKRAGKNSL